MKHSMGSLHAPSYSVSELVIINTRFMKLIFCSAMAMIIAGSASTTFAAGKTDLRYNPDGVNVTVDFADLNITNAGDARTLVDRVKVLARKVCRHANPRAALPPIAAVKNQRLCYEETYNQGIALINSRGSTDIEAVAAGSATSREIVEAE